MHHATEPFETQAPAETSGTEGGPYRPQWKLKRTNFYVCAYCGEVLDRNKPHFPLTLEDPKTLLKAQLHWHMPTCAERDELCQELADAECADDAAAFRATYEAILERSREKGPLHMERMLKIQRDTQEPGCSARYRDYWGISMKVVK